MKILAALLATAALTSVTSSAAASPPPVIHYGQQGQAFVVTGENFKPNEKVTIVVSSSGVRVRSALADNGAFRVELRSFRPAMCGPLHIVAVGNRGSHATLTSPARPCIAPPGSPGSTK